MREYLRNDERTMTNDEGIPNDESRIAAADSSLDIRVFVIPSPLFIPSFVILASLLEDARDHLVQRRVLHAHIHHGVAVEDRAEGLGDAAAVDAQVGHRPFALGHLAVALQPLRRAVG